MSSSTIILVLSLTGVWIAINAFYRYHRSVSIRSRSLTAAVSTTKLEVFTCSLHYSTTYFNAWPKRLAKSTRFSKKSWTLLYDVGVVLGLLGFVTAQMILLWSTWKSCTALYGAAETGEIVQAIVKRNIIKRSSGTTTGTNSPLMLRPLIPGINLPISSLPFLVLALLLSQSFHEFGHALSAYTDGIEMISTGIYVYVILPTCYVALPGSLTSISPISTALSNLRIATAGVYHNFILCFVIYLLQDSGGGVSNVMSGWAYQSVEGGLMITKIDPSSPLSSLLSPTLIITHLNDIELDASDEPMDQWTKYLNHRTDEKEDDYDNLGYCLPVQSFVPTTFESHADCCAVEDVTQPTKHPLCFSTSSRIQYSACLSPLSYFHPSPTIPPRCVNDKNCEPDYVCARISDFEKVLMIGVKEYHGGEERVVISQGSRRNVFNDITVSASQPRFGWIPLLFRHHLQEFYSDIQSLSLTLAFFNLLPLPHLDGSVILAAFLLLLSLLSESSNSFDLNLLESGTLSSSSSSSPRDKSIVVKFTRFCANLFGEIELDDRRRKRIVGGMERWTMTVGAVLLFSTIAVEFMGNWSAG